MIVLDHSKLMEDVSVLAGSNPLVVRSSRTLRCGSHSEGASDKAPGSEGRLQALCTSLLDYHSPSVKDDWSTSRRWLP